MYPIAKAQLEYERLVNQRGQWMNIQLKMGLIHAVSLNDMKLEDSAVLIHPIHRSWLTSEKETVDVFGHWGLSYDLFSSVRQRFNISSSRGATAAFVCLEVFSTRVVRCSQFGDWPHARLVILKCGFCEASIDVYWAEPFAAVVVSSGDLENTPSKQKQNGLYGKHIFH